VKPNACREIWKLWTKSVDQKGTSHDPSTADYVQLPQFHFDANTPFQKFKNQKCTSFHAHLFLENGFTQTGKSASSNAAASSQNAKELTWDYVAYHHFAPATLKVEGSGPTETAERYLKHSTLVCHIQKWKE
jgi:hypothetical protein